MPPARIESRWASPENPLGEKGAAAKENAGRKGRPSIALPAGAEAVLAEVRNASGTVRDLAQHGRAHTPDLAGPPLADVLGRSFETRG